MIPIVPIFPFKLIHSCLSVNLRAFSLKGAIEKLFIVTAIKFDLTCVLFAICLNSWWYKTLAENNDISFELSAQFFKLNYEINEYLLVIIL